MNFDFSDEQKLLQKTARDYLEEHAPLSVCRRVLESEETHAAPLWRGAAEMGWLGTAVPEAYGGAGFGYLELVLVAEELGRALAPIPFVPSVALASEALLLFGSEEQKREQLPGLVSGEAIGTFALAERPGLAGPEGIETRLENGRLHGAKIAVPDGAAADRAVVVARDGADVALALCELGAAGVKREAVETLDPSRPNARLRFDGAPAQVLPGARGWPAVQRLLRRAAVVQAFEQVGGAARAFEQTREYALQRYAFGRPIASFQALKHRLADAFVSIELARSNAYFGAWALAEDAPELSEAACNARISAIQAYEQASVEMIQLHGGVGYTWELDCHLFYRRAKLLAASLGSLHEWRELLVRELERSQAP